MGPAGAQWLSGREIWVCDSGKPCRLLGPPRFLATQRFVVRPVISKACLVQCVVGSWWHSINRGCCTRPHVLLGVLVPDTHPLAVSGHDTRAPRRRLRTRLCALTTCATFGVHPQQGVGLEEGPGVRHWCLCSTQVAGCHNC